MINVGDRVKDIISGFVGIAMARAVFNGCVRIQVQGSELHNGLPLEGQWIDEVQLKAIKANRPSFAKVTGGDRPDPHDLSNPK